jgi:hypothetical protein
MDPIFYPLPGNFPKTSMFCFRQLSVPPYVTNLLVPRTLPLYSKPNLSWLAQFISSSPWKHNISALNSFNLPVILLGIPLTFLSSQNIDLSWPLTLPILHLYTTWAHSSCHLHPHTIEADLSSLGKIHQLLGFPNLHTRADFLIQSLLRLSTFSFL